VGWQQDYDPYGSVLAGAVETRKGYIDKERDRESGTHNHGVRQYDPGEGGRFLSFDPLWEKYRGWSPYVYSQDNPVSLVDGNGMELDFTNFLIVDEDHTYISMLLADLCEKTGLQLGIDPETGMLKYDKVDGKAIFTPGAGSETARDLLISAIDNATVVPVAMAPEVKLSQWDGGMIGLNKDQINKLINGASKGLNPTTMGWAMVFLHEMTHSPVGKNGGLSDENSYMDLQGPTVRLMNQIRKELGAEYGQRLMYGGTEVGGDVYIPFNPLALRSLTSDPQVIPPGGLYVSSKK